MLIYDDILSTQVKELYESCKEILDFERALESETVHVRKGLQIRQNSEKKNSHVISWQFLNVFRFSPDGHLFSTKKLYRREKGEFFLSFVLVLDTVLKWSMSPAYGIKKRTWNWAKNVEPLSRRMAVVFLPLALWPQGKLKSISGERRIIH